MRTLTHLRVDGRTYATGRHTAAQLRLLATDIITARLDHPRYGQQALTSEMHLLADAAAELERTVRAVPMDTDRLRDGYVAALAAVRQVAARAGDRHQAIVSRCLVLQPLLSTAIIRTTRQE